MKFIVLNPKLKTVTEIEARNLAMAKVAADLHKVDHGSITRHLHFVVDEFGLFVEPAKQSYISLAGRLLAGNVVLYACDDGGSTIGMDHLTKSDSWSNLWNRINPIWLSTQDEVEASISVGSTFRPEISVNGEIIWSWPQPRPNL